jgi:sodium-dependent dicarboxylate transporter 2/3/5
MNPGKWFARIAGPALCLIVIAFGPDSLSREGRFTLGATAWLVTWWITECVPILATSILPLLLFPVLGIASPKQAAAPYANELVFLFMGGFFLAAALEKWESHARVAYRMVLLVGVSGKRAVLGVMLATAFISMWISNTATAAMMYPIALAIGALFADDAGGRNTRTALMLGVAYAASIGGMGTVIGTPPNLVVAAAIRELTGTAIGFAQFMAIGIPVVLILLPVCWLILVLVIFPGQTQIAGDVGGMLRQRLMALGPIRGGEKKVLILFAATALAWFCREPKDFGSVVIPGITTVLPGLTDAGIAIATSILLLLLTGVGKDGVRKPLLTVLEARAIPWEVLLFFGGGLTLAGAMDAHGINLWIGGYLEHLKGLPPVLIYLGVAVVVTALSELASNLAVATMTMPIAAALAHSVDQPPVVLMLVAGFAASAGFALPVATPPNAIVFGSGMISVRQMGKAGVLLDLIAVAVIAVIVALLAPLVL